MNFLGLDIGTTCCKCQLFSEEGEILAYKSAEYPLLTLVDGRYVDVEGIWAKVLELIAFAAGKGAVSSLCLSTFGESFVLTDQNDRVLFPPMLYTDPRGRREADELRERVGDETLFRRVGAVTQSLFSIAKLLWLKKERPDVYRKADKVMLLNDHLGYLLTGRRLLDPGLAARTGVFDPYARAFDTELMETCGISPELFSPVAPTGSVVGRVRPALCRMLGLHEDCTLVLGSHDQICAALGAGAVRAGDAADGLGTVECTTVLFDKRPASAAMGRQGYVVVPYPVNGLYCTYLFNYACGSLVRWYKNAVAHGYKGGEATFFDHMEKYMDCAPTGIVTLPYWAGAATPYADVDAKGAVVGLTAAVTDAALYRSLLEGTAMEMRLNAETVAAYGITARQATATGGGANSDKWLQTKADIQNIPFRTLRSAEGGLCGCAMLQAVAMKRADDLAQAAERFVVYDRTFAPDPGRHAAYERQYHKYKKLYSVIKEFF